MKTKTLLTALATTMAVSFGVSASAVTLKEVQDRGTVRIAVANEIPYGYMDMSGKAKGAGPEVAQHIMDELGIKKIEWITTNFGSLIPGLRANRFDMVSAEMAILPQRCKEVLFSEPNTSYGEGLLVAKGNPDDIHTFEAFAKNDKKNRHHGGRRSARNAARTGCI
jgi:polar amino acid transport system substrate-binding protein